MAPHEPAPFGGFGGLDLVTLTAGSIVAGWVNAAVRALFSALFCLAIDERVYTEGLAVQATMDRVRATHLFAEKHAVVNGRMSPTGVVFGPWFVARVKVKEPGEPFRGRRGGGGVSVTVARLRWLQPPLVPDGAIMDMSKEPVAGTVTVMRRGSDGWSVRRERACPDAVPKEAASTAAEVATRIFDAISVSRDVQMRVILSGPPGSGKSTAARLVALSLGATLVPAFDPSRPGFSVDSVLSMTPDDAMIVLSMDEFDVCLRRALSPSPSPSPSVDREGGGKECEVVDRASWNAMLDALQFVPNVVVVMSTNMTFADLENEFEPSALRAGRITHRMVVDGTLGTNDGVDGAKKTQ